MPKDTMDDAEAIRLPLASAVPLSQFLAARTFLTVADRQLIVEQAIGALEHVYVHLLIKQALYGIDPIARLRALRDRLDASGQTDDLPFHRDMVAILRTCRDMHTGYYLPRPFDRSVAFLPFQIEEFYEDGARRYVVPRVLLDSPEVAPEIRTAANFRAGVEILAWDGDPIDDAVVREGEASPGINPDARLARGMYRLTTRFMAKCPPPERSTATVTYRTQDGTVGRLEAAWRVALLPAGIAVLPEGAAIDQAPLAGFDVETEVFRAMKRELNARQADQHLPKDRDTAPLQTDLPLVFEAFERKGPDGTAYGYLRIRSFVVEDATMASREFARLVAELPKSGLVIDVRDNPGGSIQAAEMMLQALASHRLERAPLVFRATPFIMRLCERRPGEYRRWTPTVARAQRTGVVFSGGMPLCPDAAYEGIPHCHAGPIVLIVNALSYSATDFFAAGFQDHAIGRVLGVHSSTGGGGANVRSVQSLVDEIGADRGHFADLWSPLPLPAAAEIHVAFRRSLRTGLHAGLEIEDFGVTPDVPVYRMTRRDALEGNPDLFATAAGLLKRQLDSRQRTTEARGIN